MADKRDRLGYEGWLAAIVGKIEKFVEYEIAADGNGEDKDR